MVSIPKWFKIGAKIWFMGFGNPVEVISIDDGELYLCPQNEIPHWIGKDIDGLSKHLLVDVVEPHSWWLPYHIDFRKKR